jgi:hypothetical protein
VDGDVRRKARARKLAPYNDRYRNEKDVRSIFDDILGPMSTPLSVRNSGNGVARKIQIQPLKLRSGTAGFREVDHLAPGKEMEIIPEVANCSPLFRYNLLNLFQREANETSAKEEMRISMAATFVDQNETRAPLRWPKVQLTRLRQESTSPCFIRSILCVEERTLPNATEGTETRGIPDSMILAMVRASKN